MNFDTIFGGAPDGRVYAVRKSTGELLWAKQLDSQIASQLTVIGSRLYLGAEDGSAYAVEQQTGEVVWRYQTRGAIRGRFAVADDLVYFGSADGYVYAVSEDKGRRRWRSRTGASVQSVLSVRDGLLATSFDNFVYFLSLTNGNRLWKRQLAGRLAAEPLATIDGVLFTPLSGDNGIVLNLKDGKQLNTLPLGVESSSSASPIMAGHILLVTTRRGLLAFSQPKIDPSKTTTVREPLINVIRQ
jgi:outer membrane protein assembly factor BamB